MYYIFLSVWLFRRCSLDSPPPPRYLHIDIVTPSIMQQAKGLQENTL